MGCVPTFLDGDCVLSPLEAARLGVSPDPLFSQDGIVGPGFSNATVGERKDGTKTRRRTLLF